MSVLDDLRGLETRVASRMKELRPLVEEYHELERVAQRLGLRSDPAPATAPRNNGQGSTRSARRATRRAKPSGTRRRARPAAPGERRQQIIDAVSQRPGITVREIGVQLGVDPTSLYRSLRALESEGVIDKRGRELHPG
jgi:DNA-binding transcriptional ArsR family regulator